MKKNKIFFIILIVFAFQIVHSQNPIQRQQKPNPELILDKDYFLLGTLSDYMGRQKTYKNDNFIDNYYEGETLLMSYIMKIYSDESPEFVVEKSQNPYSSVTDILNSKKIADKMNSFYNFKNDGGFRIDPSFFKLKAKEFRKSLDDFNKSTETKDTVYVGTMKENVKKVKQLILEEFEKVSKDLSQKELEEVKEQLIGNYHIGMEDSQAQMVNLLVEEMNGNAEEFYKFEKNVRSVKLEEVKKLAKLKDYSFLALVPED